MNSTNKFYSAIAKNIDLSYPSVKQAGFTQSDFDHVIAPFSLSIDSCLANKLHAAVAAIHSLSHDSGYTAKINVSPHDQKILKLNARTGSVLMAYDFHLNSDQTEARLVEINTNASGYPLAALAYAVHGYSNESAVALEQLRDSFDQELRLKHTKSPEITILDEHIKEQKMFIEFLIYQDLFKSWGVDSKMTSVEEVSLSAAGQLVDKSQEQLTRVYNRYCDFTFSEARSKAFLTAYESEYCRISPHPREYILLADKQRLVEWSDPNWWSKEQKSESSYEAIQNVLLQTRTPADFKSSAEIWGLRKKLFFKPKNSFGGKSTYRGKSITKGKFEEIIQSDCIVQEYFPAHELELDTDGEKKKWKYDLRCFVYQEKIQLMAARFYQGQVTNFSNQFSGFAPVVVVSPDQR